MSVCLYFYVVDGLFWSQERKKKTWEKEKQVLPVW